MTQDKASRQHRSHNSWAEAEGDDSRHELSQGKAHRESQKVVAEVTPGERGWALDSGFHCTEQWRKWLWIAASPPSY